MDKVNVEMHDSESGDNCKKVKVGAVSENKWILKMYEVNVENAWKWKWKWRSSPGNDLPRRYGEFPLEFASTPICDIDPYYAGFFKITMLVLFNGILGFDLISLIASIPFHSKVSAVLLLTQFLFQTRRPSSSSAKEAQYSGMQFKKKLLSFSDMILTSRKKETKISSSQILGRESIISTFPFPSYSPVSSTYQS